MFKHSDKYLMSQIFNASFLAFSAYYFFYASMKDKFVFITHDIKMWDPIHKANEWGFKCLSHFNQQKNVKASF